LDVLRPKYKEKRPDNVSENKLPRVHFINRTDKKAVMQDL
jgi:hypothetical protein